ncbi:DDE_3 domain-containing protein [Trichonephila clavipes]|nr:DDE_3 domain-containing protein [Trichonephila clavipes]
MCIPTDLENLSRTMRHPTHPKLLEWLQEQTSEFRHFRWSTKSPDMSIIEYIWDALQRAVQKRSLLPHTPTDLWTALQDSWRDAR